MSKAMPREIQFANPHVQQITNERRFAQKGDTSSAPSKTGLTGDAASEQANAFDALSERRRRFSTVFAGETGTGGNDKLGLVGKI